MRLTPADVHNVAFKKPSIGKRGYDEDEVDAFLDIVEAELIQLIEENNELRQQVAAYEAGQTPPASTADAADAADAAVAPTVDGAATGELGTSAFAEAEEQRPDDQPAAPLGDGDEPYPHDGPITAEQPAVQQPAVEQPAVEQPAVEQPAVEQPAV